MGKSEEETTSESVCGRVEVPTEDEVRALSALRAIKERVRGIKKTIRELSPQEQEGGGETLHSLEGELEELRGRWKEWEDKRKKAARERMIRLGHEDP